MKRQWPFILVMCVLAALPAYGWKIPAALRGEQKSVTINFSGIPVSSYKEGKALFDAEVKKIEQLAEKEMPGMSVPSYKNYSVSHYESGYQLDGTVNYILDAATAERFSGVLTLHKFTVNTNEYQGCLGR